MVVDLTQVGSTAPSLSMPSISGDGISTMIVIVCFLIVMGGIGMFLFILSKYKTKIPVIEITRNGLLLKHVRVMRKKETEGTETAFRYKVFGKNITVPITENPQDIYIMDLKGNFIPSQIDDFDKLVKVKPADIEYWYINQQREASSTYGNTSFWDKYGIVVTGAVMLIIMLIAIVIIMSKLQDITVGLNNVADAFRTGKIVLSLPQGQ